ncbi:MAG: hypothetical protein A3A33_03920 [Candidatus Yanofskybacteria bacterium RIFCSPLOWO2_01_FULL_49_25]|uniref:Uncharacterized protein n=1 Tax=Candidatus Yanofskybacteria bacterium RIFCSPLOWO2_01_FULL_49_25 TaxID=1802701 RepID=A0A1F8GTU1_9BACT|nr:MAG: hypothetical protein A3A33_03920 [Candidatus Yanofskybacteria bacterium RIFCSPLOWO2_01_FULL_49_25]
MGLAILRIKKSWATWFAEIYRALTRGSRCQWSFTMTGGDVHFFFLKVYELYTVQLLIPWVSGSGELKTGYPRAKGGFIVRFIKNGEKTPVYVRRFELGSHIVARVLNSFRANMVRAWRRPICFDCGQQMILKATGKGIENWCGGPEGNEHPVRIVYFDYGVPRKYLDGEDGIHTDRMRRLYRRDRKEAARRLAFKVAAHRRDGANSNSTT